MFGDSLGASGAEALMAYLEQWLEGKGEAAAHLPELLDLQSAGSGQGDTSQLSVAASGSGPSVSTDKADYAPGETALISGSGFEPGSTVQITILETADKDLDGPGPDNAELDDYGTVATVTVAADGTFEATWLVPPRPDASALGATLELTASSSSGETATTTFTDAELTLTATGTTVTLDEDQGLQNLTATPAPPSDADDNDIPFASVPADFKNRLDSLTGSATPINAALSGYNGANSGSALINITGTYTNLAFTDGNKNLLNGLDSGLDTLAGNSIFLYTDPTNDNIVLGREGSGTTPSATGDIVFAAYLDEAGDKLSARIWTVLYEPLVHPNPLSTDEPVDLNDKLYVTALSTQDFSLDDAPSGQQLFIMFGDGNITDGVNEVGIVATGKNPANQSAGEAVNSFDTVNTSQASKFGDATFGTNNQMINPDQGIWFTFVKNPNPDYTVPNLAPGEAGTEANIQFTDWDNATGAEFTVVQLQSGKSAVVTISAYLEDDSAATSSGTNFVDKLREDQDGEKVTITGVTVVNHEGASPVVTDNGDGTWTISGIEAGDLIQYQTDGNHNRVLIENDGTGTGQHSAAFDIGGFTLNNAQTTALEVGDKVFFEDSGPSGSGAAYTPPTAVYLFDGNARWNNNPDGNYEGNNGSGAPTGDANANGPNSVQVNFATAFTAASFAGQDGIKNLSYAFSLVLAVNEGDPVKFDPSRDITNSIAGTAVTSDGLPVVWHVVTAGSAYEGRVNTGTEQDPVWETVFSLAITPAGLVTFTQSRQLDHTRADTASPFTTDLWFLDGQQISVQRIASALDGDNDPISETELGDLAGVFAIGDDAPKTTVGSIADSNQLITADAAAVGTSGNYTGGYPAFATASYDAVFEAAVTASYGADGAGSKDAAGFELDLGVANGTSSGLTSNDSTVYLYAVGSGSSRVIYGSTTTSVNWDPDNPDNLVFKVEVTDAATGTVKLTQLAQVDHGTALANPSDPNSATSGFPADSRTLADNLIVLKANVTTTDGETNFDSVINNLTLNIGSDLEFRDDGPNVAFDDLIGTVTTATQSGNWSGSVGADTPGILSIAAVDTDPNAAGIQFDMVTPTGVQSTGTITAFAFNSNTNSGTGTLSADFDNNPGNGNETIGFTLAVNADGTYDITLDAIYQPLMVLSTDQGQLPAGGPDPVQTLTFDSTSFVFFAVDAGTALTPAQIAGTAGYNPPYGNSAIGLGETDLSETQLQNQSAMINIDGSGNNGTGLFPFIRDELEMNVSTSGIGVGNNVLQGYDPLGGTSGAINPFVPGDLPDKDESFVLNPGPLAASVKVYISKTAGGFLPPNDDLSLQGSAAKTDWLYFNVYDELGNYTGHILVTSDMVVDEAAPGGTGENLWSFTIDMDDVSLAGDYIDAVQFTMGFGDIKIVKMDVVVEGNMPPNDILLDFEATLADNDTNGSSDTVTSAFEVNLYGNETTVNPDDYDYILQGGTAGSSPEAFNVHDQADPLNRYLIQGFDASEDFLVLNNLATSYTLQTGLDLVGSDGTNDSLVTSDSGDLYVVVANATLTASDIIVSV
jgi:hypothetical protein